MLSRPVGGMVPSPSLADPENAPSTPHLLSLDALRGFDMFWIIGGEELLGRSPT